MKFVLAVIAVVLAVSTSVRGQCEVTEIQKLVAPDGEAGGYFGQCLSLGDEVAVIGAWRTDIGRYEDAGCAYVYRYRGNVWQHEDTLLPPKPATDLGFGVSVALHLDRIVIGAPGLGSGYAYVYWYDGHGWRLEETLSPVDGAGGDWYGGRVAIEYDRIAVGAIMDDDEGIDSGSAYVYRRRAGGWALEDKIVAWDGEPGDHFGGAVSVSGDRVLVGAMEKTWMQGAAYVFRFNGAHWLPEQQLLGGRNDGDFFGGSVALQVVSGLPEWAVVSASNEHGVDDDTGAVYVFRHNGTRWTLETKLTAPDAERLDYFGRWVSLYKNVLAIGSFQDRVGGSAYVYRNGGGAWILKQKLRASDAAGGDQLGGSVAVRLPFALAGAKGDDDRGAESGSAYVFSAVPDLSLRASSTTLSAGDNVTLSAAFGYPGELVALLQTAPGLRLVALGTYRAPSFKWTISATVPPGLEGLDVTLQSAGLTMCGDLDWSNQVTLRFR